MRPYRFIAALLSVSVIAAGLAFIATANAAPAINDDFAQAAGLTLGVEKDFSITDATGEVGEFSCGGQQTVWYSFTAPADGDYVAYTAESNFDAFVGWFSVINISLACDDHTAGTNDGLPPPMAMTNGQTVYVQVSHFATATSGVRGSGRVGAAAVEAAADNFADAPSLGFLGDSSTAFKAVDADILPPRRLGPRGGRTNGVRHRHDGRHVHLDELHPFN
jgi:hypothetical protein